MKTIDGVNYYILSEIVEKIKEEAGVELDMDNSTRQWFYRMKLPKIEGNHGCHHLYREDGVREVVGYYTRKKRIRELAEELKDLRHTNTEFIAKYKWKW